MHPDLHRLLLFPLLLLCAQCTTGTSIDQRGIRKPGTILMYLPHAVRSHKNVWLPLAMGLAERGHKVTMVTSIPHESYVENYEEIVVETSKEFSEEISWNLLNPSSSLNQRAWRFWSFLSRYTTEIWDVHDKVLQHPDMKILLSNSSTHFDVTFVSPMMNEMGLNFAHRFNSSVILYLTSVAGPLLSASMGYYENPSLASYSMTGQHEVPGFGQRMLYFLLWMYYWQFKQLCSSQQDQLWIHHFPNDHLKPDLVQLEKQASFAMYFSHYVFDSIRPTLPNTIDVGTIHCRSPKPVPDSLDQLISSHDQGFVMVSFGSWLQPEHMPDTKLQVLIAALSRIPYLVLFKWKNSTQTFPYNIKPQSWLPQQDLLGHDKIKLFITQGGMMSVQESLCHGVPMVVLPIFGDQMSNGARVERQGAGRVVSLDDMNEDKLVETMMEVIRNSSYKTMATRLRDLLHDDIQTPLQKAIFWTEYVMRHPGAHHLQSHLLKQIPAWKFFNLDLIFILIVTLIGCSALITWILWLFMKKIVATLIS